MLSEKHLLDFCRIYRNLYGAEITPEQAKPTALALLRLYELVYSDTPPDSAEIGPTQEDGGGDAEIPGQQTAPS